MSRNLLKSLRMFCIIILQHQVLVDIIAFNICITDFNICISYMHNESCIYQTKNCRTTFVALPRLACLIFNGQDNINKSKSQ